MLDMQNPYWILRDLARRAIENGGPRRSLPLGLISLRGIPQATGW